MAWPFQRVDLCRWVAENVSVETFARGRYLQLGGDDRHFVHGRGCDDLDRDMERNSVRQKSRHGKGSFARQRFVVVRVANDRNRAPRSEFLGKSNENILRLEGENYRTPRVRDLSWSGDRRHGSGWRYGLRDGRRGCADNRGAWGRRATTATTATTTAAAAR